MDIMSYISNNNLILIPVLYVIGYIVKEYNRIPNCIIPTLLLLISISLTVMMNGASASSLIQGILLVGTTVYSNQLLKQLIELKDFLSQK